MTAAVHQGGGWAQPDHVARTDSVPTLEDRLGWVHRQALRVPGEQALLLVGLGLITGVFRVIDDQGPWLWWLVPCLCAWLLRSWLHRRLVRQLSSAPAGELLRWDRRHRRLLLLQGSLTGLACSAYQPMASGVNQSVLLTVAFVCVAGAIPSLTHRLPLFAAYAALTAGPLALAVLLDTADIDHLYLVGLLVLLMMLVLWLMSSHLALVGHLRQQKARVDHLRGQLTEQVAQARSAHLAAEEASQAKTRLIAAASHDLRQPLLALGLHGLQLRSRLCQPRDVEVLDGLTRGVQALDTMLSDLLDYARAEDGALTPALQPVRMDLLYRRLLPQVTPCAFDRGLHLAWHGEHHTVWADPVMVERCLRNLILNAINHTDTGGVVVGARRRGNELLLQVWDSGCGLSPEAQRRIFEDYYCEPRATSTRASLRSPVLVSRPDAVAAGTAPRQGTGLGLGIVRRFSHLMGARVSLRSRVGRGSVFELAFQDRPDASA